MMSGPRIPNIVATVVGQVLGSHYHSHRILDTLFMEKGAPGDSPEGNCQEKCIKWLKRASSDPTVDAFAVLGGVLEEFMELDRPRLPHSEEDLNRSRERVLDIFAKFGMSYQQGGRITGASTAAPTRSLDAILRARDLGALETEFHRALENVEADPSSAITAACAAVESFCKIYIGDEGLTPPADKSVKPLWKTVQSHLGLDPAQMPEDDLKRILSGLTSIVDGIGACRTHVGSAHGQGRRPYRPRDTLDSRFTRPIR